jgi:hypothetical protein
VTTNTNTILTPDNAATLLASEDAGIERMTFGGKKIRTTRDAQTQGVNLTIYGPAGHGKTTLAATARESQYAHPIYFVDAEGGCEVLSHTDIEYNPYYEWREIERFLRALKTEKEIPWKTVVWDNLTELSAMCLRSISEEPTLPDYGTLTRNMLAFIREVRELSRKRGINMIFNAWDVWEKDDAQGTFRKDIQLTPSLQKAYPGIVSIVGHLSVNRKGQRILTFKPGPQTISKFRRTPDSLANKIPDVLVNPSLAPIFDTLLGDVPFPAKRYALTAATDNAQPGTGDD